jgi:hypothetical protein
MGVRYIGGGFLVGIPRRDMTGGELADMPADYVAAIQRCGFYKPCADEDVTTARRDWRVVRVKPLRVMVFCPTYRLEPETVQAIFGQDYIGATDFYFTRDNPYSQEVQRGYFNIWHNLTKARRHFLAANYDAMLIVESDIIPPADALTKLVSLDADVAGGLYVMRHGAPVANAFVHVPEQDSPGTYMLKAELDGVQKTNGVCMGITLIHRHVIEAVPFKMHDTAAPDWAFMTDCNAAGYVTLCDTSIRCGHKKPSGEILWPDCAL